MPQRLHLDYETFSEIDPRDVGAYRYAFDPSTEILCAAMALDDGEPVIWYPGMCDSRRWKSGFPPGSIRDLEPHFDALENPDVLIYAHNAQFEIAISQALMLRTWNIDPPSIDRWRCSMSLARRAALPGSLDKLGGVLGLSTQKDKRGKAFVKKFSMIQKEKKATKTRPVIPAHRIFPEDEPEDFADFLSYCKTDVVVEREATKLLSYFDEPINNSNFTLHETINARGVAVNLVALKNAQKLIDEETILAGERFRKLTGFEHTQNKVLLEWVNANDYGYSFEDLQAETIDTFLEKFEDMPDEQVDETVLALRIKQSVAYVSIKKVQAMLDCAGPFDNRIRGMLNHHGATTGRSTNSLVQFQNMKRPAGHLAAPTFKGSKETWSEVAYKAICDGISREELELCFGPVLEVISSCIRHFVHDI